MAYPALNARVVAAGAGGRPREAWVGLTLEDYARGVEAALRQALGAPAARFEVYDQIDETLGVRCRGATFEDLTAGAARRGRVPKLARAGGRPLAVVDVPLPGPGGRGAAEAREVEAAAAAALGDGVVPFARRDGPALLATPCLEGFGRARLREDVAAASRSEIGDREYQEDRVVAGAYPRDGPVCRVVGVLDGHGGADTADAAAEGLPEQIGRALAALDDGEGAAEAIVEAFVAFNAALAAEEGRRHREFAADGLEDAGDDRARDAGFGSGSTASLAVFYGDRVFAANLGDSRLILAGRGFDDLSRVFATRDQKPAAPDERRELERRGGEVAYWGGAWRVNGFAVARALGDFGAGGRLRYAPDAARDVIRAVPVVEAFPRRDYNVVFAASDGFWDVVRTAEVLPILAREGGPEAVAEQALALALDRPVRGRDNTTVVVYADDSFLREGIAASPARPPALRWSGVADFEG